MAIEDLGHGMTAAQVAARAFNSDAQLDRVCDILKAAVVWFEDNRGSGVTSLPPWVIQARAALGRKPR